MGSPSPWPPFPTGAPYPSPTLTTVGSRVTHSGLAPLLQMNPCVHQFTVIGHLALSGKEAGQLGRETQWQGCGRTGARSGLLSGREGGRPLPLGTSADSQLHMSHHPSHSGYGVREAKNGWCS